MDRAEQLLHQLVDQRKQLASDVTTDLAAIDSTMAEIREVVRSYQKQLRLLDAPAIMNISVVARYLRISRHTVHALLQDGQLQGRIHGNRIVVLKEDVDAWRRSLPPTKRIHQEFPEGS